jgi:hypothetical protein
MKRNWLTYVSIVAALLAGMACSTAFADGKRGMQFSGGSLRLGSGGGSAPKMQFNGNNAIRSQNLGGISGNSGGLQSQGFPKVIKNPQIGNGLGQAISGNGGQNLGGIRVAPRNGNSTPKITINPGIGQSIGNAIGNGHKPQIGVNPNIGQAIGNAIGGKTKIDPGFGVGKSIGNAVLGNGSINPSGSVRHAIGNAVLKHCVPACDPKPCDPCHNHHNKWCGPCWWWSPCWDPCYKSCYYPCSVYVQPQVYVIPVQTVVAGAPVQQVAAEPVMQIPVGATITLQGTDLGDQLGMLVVQIDKISLPAQVNEWKPDAVNVTLPMLGLAGPMRAQLWMVRADGAVAANVAVELLPAQQQAAGAVGQAEVGQAAGQDAAAAALSAIQ